MSKEYKGEWIRDGEYTIQHHPDGKAEWLCEFCKEVIGEAKGLYGSEDCHELMKTHFINCKNLKENK